MAAFAAEIGGQSPRFLVYGNVVAPEELGCVADLAHETAHFAHPKLALHGEKRPWILSILHPRISDQRQERLHNERLIARSISRQRRFPAAKLLADVGQRPYRIPHYRQ